MEALGAQQAAQQAALEQPGSGIVEGCFPVGRQKDLQWLFECRVAPIAEAGGGFATLAERGFIKSRRLCVHGDIFGPIPAQALAPIASAEHSCVMPDSARQIENLLYTYAERIDAGDFEGLADLFHHGRIEPSPDAPGRDAVVGRA